MARKRKVIKAPCHQLNRILLLKILTEKQEEAVQNRLIKLIKECKAGNFDFIPYIKVVIIGCLDTEEKEYFVKIIKELDDTESSVAKQGKLHILAAYYETIVEFYPELSYSLIA